MPARRTIICNQCENHGLYGGYGMCIPCYNYQYFRASDESGYTHSKWNTARCHGLTAAEYVERVEMEPCVICQSQSSSRVIRNGDVICHSCRRSLDCYLKTGIESHRTKDEWWWAAALAYLDDTHDSNDSDNHSHNDDRRAERASLYSVSGAKRSLSAMLTLPLYQCDHPD